MAFNRRNARGPAEKRAVTKINRGNERGFRGYENKPRKPHASPQDRAHFRG